MTRRVDWPFGTPEERAVAIDHLPGTWENDNPYLNKYRFGFHTGGDFNDNKPHWNQDAGSPVYAAGKGYVVYSGIGRGKTWGWIIIIDHGDFMARYAHVNHIAFKPPAIGDTVVCGQQISLVGNGDGYYSNGGDHLHFDIVTTDILKRDPSDWPGLDKARLIANYVDPVKFIIDRKKAQSMADTINAPDTLVRVKLKAPSTIDVYQIADTDSPVLVRLKIGDTADVDSANPKVDPKTGIRMFPTPDDRWITEECLDFENPLPAPVPAPQPLREMVVASTDGLNLRSTPDTSKPKIKTLPFGTRVTVRGNGLWLEVTAINGVAATGYVSAVYLKAPGSVPPPVTLPPSKSVGGMGPHFLGGLDMTVVGSMRGPVFKSVENPGALQVAHNNNPDAISIYRKFYDVGDQSNRIREIQSIGLEAAVNKLLSEMADVIRDLPWAYFEGYNEVGGSPLIMAFEELRVKKLAAMGRKACVLNIGVGQTSPAMWNMPEAQRMVAAVNSNGGIVGVHCYSQTFITANNGDSYFDVNGNWVGELWPAHLDPDKCYAAFRILKDKQVLPAQTRLVATEWGLDDLHNNENGIYYPFGIKTRGWRTCIPIWQRLGLLNGISAEQLMRKQMDYWVSMTGCLATPFMWGDKPDWSDFDMRGVM